MPIVSSCRLPVVFPESITNNCDSTCVQFFFRRIHSFGIYFTVIIITTTTVFITYLCSINSLRLSQKVSESTLWCLSTLNSRRTVNDDIQMKLTHTSDNSLCMSISCDLYVHGMSGLPSASLQSFTSLPCPALVLGSIASSITGSQIPLGLQDYGCCSSPDCIAVVVNLNPISLRLSSSTYNNW